MTVNNMLLAAAFALTLTTLANAQDENPAPAASDVNVVNAVSVYSSDDAPIVVRGTTALAFNATDLAFESGDQILADIDVSRFQQVRLAIRAKGREGFPVSIWIVEDGIEVARLDSFIVNVCPQGDVCSAYYAEMRTYETPGRTLRIRATGAAFADVTVFGR